MLISLQLDLNKCIPLSFIIDIVKIVWEVANVAKLYIVNDVKK